MYTRLLSNISKHDAPLVGGKGASLGEMLQSNIPVPDGYVVLSTTFDEFLHKSDLAQEIDAILESVDHKTISSVESASEKIQELIKHASMPEDIKAEIESQFSLLNSEFVAVRSSATAEDGADHAWAGQLESYLNTTQDTLLEKVQHCWASLFTPRAIFYRFEKGLHTTAISVAVVVQKMVNSEKSGIAFSVHPVTEDRNQIIIEAGFGLGEAIVSGSVTPDSYIISKQPREIIDTNINHQNRALYRRSGGGNEWIDLDNDTSKQQVLTMEQILELGNIIITIENHYGFPCDIEWAYEGGKFYIVQSRPITTLNNKSFLTSSSQSNISPERRPTEKNFSRSDYMLSFWAQGVSVFVTDIHLDAYQKLEVLYIIDQGMFKQYFTHIAYERALDQGLEFYRDTNAFDQYRKDLFTHCNRFKNFFESEIEGKEFLTRETVTIFFEYTKKLCGDYAKMNFEFTDKAFQYQDRNVTIKKNLEGVAVFKDQIRTIMNTVLFEPTGYAATTFTILGNQFDLESSIFNDLTQQEIYALFDEIRPNNQVIKKRQEAFVEHNDNQRYYEGKNAEPIIWEFREKVIRKDILQGQTASKGRVSGKVKVIPVDYGNMERVNAEIEKMEQGDILVAETTAPELLIACKKASAIITDMGGLMSHAAIVSREFNIPCIVATKNASKILKDGDLVEINGDTGEISFITPYK